MTLLELFQPLLLAVPPEKYQEGIRLLETHPQALFNWGLKSGYLLWTRHHPGEIPHMALVRLWEETARDWSVN